MKYIIRKFKSLEDSGLLIEGVSKKIQNEVKEQRGGTLSILLGTLGASLLGDILTSGGINRAGEGIVRTAYGNKRQDHKQRIFNAALSFNYFEIQKQYQNEPRFKGAHSIDNLPEPSSTEIKDGAYVINPDGYSDIGTHWVALYVQNNDVTYFHSFGVEHIPKEIKTFIGNKNIKANIFRIQAYDSIFYNVQIFLFWIY